MTYREQAEHLLRRVVFDPDSGDYSIVVNEIAESLQEAFDLGYCAAGGLIYPISANRR